MRSLHRRYGHAGIDWVPPAMMREGFGHVKLEALLTVAGWPKMAAPPPGESVVFDRDGWTPLREEGYIKFLQPTRGLESRGRYVLTDKGSAAVGQYRLAVRALSEKYGKKGGR